MALCRADEPPVRALRGVSEAYEGAKSPHRGPYGGDRGATGGEFTL